MKSALITLLKEVLIPAAEVLDDEDSKILEVLEQIPDTLARESDRLRSVAVSRIGGDYGSSLKVELRIFCRVLCHTVLAGLLTREPEKEIAEQMDMLAIGLREVVGFYKKSLNDGGDR